MDPLNDAEHFLSMLRAAVQQALRRLRLWAVAIIQQEHSWPNLQWPQP